jgi:hypothetical protein
MFPRWLKFEPLSKANAATMKAELARSMRLSRPAEHPVDDLTPRLVAAMGKAVIEGAEGTVEKAAKSALDLLLR